MDGSEGIGGSGVMLVGYVASRVWARKILEERFLRRQKQEPDSDAWMTEEKVLWCKPHKGCCTGYSSDGLVRGRKKNTGHQGGNGTRGRFLSV